MDDADADGEGHWRLKRQFLEAVDRHEASVDRRDSSVLLPTSLVRAAAQVLSADGAALSVADGRITVPIGVSDPAAAAVERLQFTVGEGPFHTALDSLTSVTADIDTHAGQWPVLAAEVNRRTAFRSVLAWPFLLGGNVRGVLELYFTAPDGASNADAIGAHVVLGLVAGRLLVDADDADDDDADADADATVTGGTAADPDPGGSGVGGPQWVVGGVAHTRLGIWVVVGMVMSRTRLPSRDSLDVLRAAAFSRGEDLDLLCAAVVEQRVPLDTVLG